VGRLLGLVAGTLIAGVTWIGYKVGWFSFGSDLDESMWGAGLAFVGVAIVAVVVTMMTTSRPVSELQGLVYGMANVDEYAARRVYKWWESPRLLGYSVLAGAAILTIIFW
jgi:solute:Na+ symporter, SSS family